MVEFVLSKGCLIGKVFFFAKYTHQHLTSYELNANACVNEKTPNNLQKLYSHYYSWSIDKCTGYFFFRIGVVTRQLLRLCQKKYSFCVYFCFFFCYYLKRRLTQNVLTYNGSGDGVLRKSANSI